MPDSTTLFWTMIAEGVQACSSVLLFAVAIISAWWVRNQLTEQRRARQLEYAPFLIFEHTTVVGHGFQGVSTDQFTVIEKWKSRIENRAIPQERIGVQRYTFKITNHGRAVATEVKIPYTLQVKEFGAKEYEDSIRGECTAYLIEPQKSVTCQEFVDVSYYPSFQIVPGQPIVKGIGNEVYRDTFVAPAPIIGNNQPVWNGEPQATRLTSIQHVYAELQEGVDTNISLKPGQVLRISARGVISFDGGNHFTNPDGFWCNRDGQPVVNEKGYNVYMTESNTLLERTRYPGIVGALVGWIGEFEDGVPFLVGRSRELRVDRAGMLHLAVNDVKRTYGDNHDSDGSRMSFVAQIEVG